MRNIVVGTFLSLDGVMQAPGGPEEDPTGGFVHGGWSTTYWDDLMGQYMEEAMMAAQERVNGADDYAREVLTQLQQQLSRHLTIIEKGLSSLDERE